MEVNCPCCGKDPNSIFCSCRLDLHCKACRMCGKHCECRVPKLVPVQHLASKSTNGSGVEARKVEVKGGRCSSPNCKAKIYWIPHPTTGKLHPWNDPKGISSHFSTCPDAAMFRKSPKR